jgi:hypothetical protein
MSEKYPEWPNDRQLIEAVTVGEMMHHCVLAMVRLDTYYVQSIVDRLAGYEMVAKDNETKRLFNTLVEALNQWLDNA